MTKTKNSNPWLYKQGDDWKVNPDKLGQAFMNKYHYFNTSQYLPGYYYQGQYYKNFETEKDKESFIRNKMAKMLDEHYSPQIINKALAYVSDHSRNDRLEGKFDENKTWVSFKNIAIDVTTLKTKQNYYSNYILNGFDFPIDTSGQPAPKTLAMIKELVGESSQFMMEFFGYFFKPDYQPFQTLVILQGRAGTGKSTLTNLFSEYFTRSTKSSVSLEQLANDKFATASLYGKWANISNDLEESYIPKVSIIKQLTGSDSIMAQYKNGPQFYFVNRATMLFTSNEVPSFPSGDGLARRVLIVPVTGQPKADKETTTVFDMKPYIDERPQGAYMFIKAFHDAYKRQNSQDGNRVGWTISNIMREKTNEWSKSLDVVGEWVSEHIKEKEGRRPKGSEVYENYKRDMESQGNHPMSLGKLYLELEKRGIEVKKIDSISSHDEPGSTKRLINHYYVK